MNSNKKQYIELCDKTEAIPLFSQAWWINAVSGENNWDVITVKKNNELIAAMPYYFRRGFIKQLKNPPLSQSLKIWINYPKSRKYSNKLAFEKEALNELIRAFPKIDSFNYSIHHSSTNWLPFYWNGFKQTTRYTYIIKDISNLDHVSANFRHNIRGDIRKADKLLKVHTSEDINLFYKINAMTFERLGKKVPYSKELLIRLDDACKKRTCRKMFFAYDDQNRVHSVLYLVWDSNSAYYLMGGSDPKLRNSGAASKLMWEAIKHSSHVSKSFDFEGSINEPVERFVRAFGGEQVPYFNLSKNNSFILLTKQYLKDLKKIIMNNKTVL